MLDDLKQIRANIAWLEATTPSGKALSGDTAPSARHRKQQTLRQLKNRYQQELHEQGLISHTKKPGQHFIEVNGQRFDIRPLRNLRSGRRFCTAPLPDLDGTLRAYGANGRYVMEIYPEEK